MFIVMICSLYQGSSSINSQYRCHPQQRNFRKNEMVINQEQLREEHLMSNTNMTLINEFKIVINAIAYYEEIYNYDKQHIELFQPI